MGHALKGDQPANPLSDDRVRALVTAASSGDAGAWRELVGGFSRRVYAFAKSRCGNAELAEEVAQSVFVTVAEKLGTGLYQEQGRFEAWLFRIAINRLRDEMRRSKRHATPTDPANLTSTPGHESGLESDSTADRDRLRALRRAMRELSDAEQEVIHLRHHAELSFKQIAELLGEPLGTLLARHHRALKKLHTKLSAAENHHAASSDGGHRS